MSRSRDPAWMGLAQRAYGVCLYLYPAAIRAAHGEDMRQAFRDRCREVARGERSAWQWFAAELAPDVLASATRSQLAEGNGGSNARTLTGLVMLCLLALALATQPRWSTASTDAIKATGRLVDVVQAAREVKHQEAFASALATSILRHHDAESVAVAALVHRVQFDQRWVPQALWEDQAPMQMRWGESGARATALAAPVFTGEATLPALLIAARACSIAAGCNEDMAIKRLLERDPENAIGWMMAFKRAAQRGDAAGMQVALDGAAAARYADAHVADIQRIVFRQVVQDHPGDGRAMADAGALFQAMQGIPTDDYRNDLRVQCSLRQHADMPRRWVDEHPASRAACIHLAALLAASKDASDAAYGWRQLRRAGLAGDPTRERGMRDAAWLAQASRGIGGQVFSIERRKSTPPWTLDDWQRWNAAWAPGDGEVPALRRWLRATGQLVHAPPDSEDFHAGS